MTDVDLIPHPTELHLVMHDLLPRMIDVVETTDLSPEMRRVRFQITDPADFRFLPMSPDEHVKLFFTHPETGKIEMPVVTPDSMTLPVDGPYPIYRDYTVRSYDRDLGLLDIDFVVHAHGVAGAWAAAAVPGDRLGMLGPRGSHIYPTGYDWYLLGADDTALPALGRWLEELPADKKVIGVVEVSRPDTVVELPERPGAEITVVYRNGVAPGNSPVLHEAIKALTADPAELPDGEFFCWVAGEANSLKPIRRHLRRGLGLPKDRVRVDGYWRNGTTNLDHHEADGDDQNGDDQNAG